MGLALFIRTMYEDEIALANSANEIFMEMKAMDEKRFYSPTEIQMKNVVRGDDRYVPRDDRMFLAAMVCFAAVAFLLVLYFGS